MKKIMFLLLPALLLTICSCNENLNLEDGNADYKFLKEMTIHDGNGNSADLLVYANTVEALAAQTEDVLYLTTSSREFPKSINTISEDHGSENQSSEEEDNIDVDDVYVLVTNFSMNSEVTGFSVRSKIEKFQSDKIEKRATATEYQYSYGASGTTGAWVEYVSQTCSNEYLTTKLSKKNSSSSLFWNELASGTLNSPGNEWYYNSSTSYYRFKLRVRGKQGCTGTAYYDYEWLT